ncbi:hypothetical protein SELMODRAFT_414846 [Selaginella moellendorffii]|uniref:Uncharacterized protein n=1 Tax=Selaginella moellendorffii TaxID=88036 RepID=D8RUU3_SELML|nr:hypothetical protein SELMODRAFT_414846 [Selaginella moellendorffii]
MASVEEVRNSYNFVQAGLSTLAAAASVALCLARGRLDSEMGLADLFGTTRLRAQNNHGALISHVGDNGTIVGVNVHGQNPNTVHWVAHNTWVLGSCCVLVPLWSKYEANSADGCTCWHIPSITFKGTGRDPTPIVNGAAAVASDPQCCKIPSYQCDVHGKGTMQDLHARVIRDTSGGLALNSMMLEGPSQLYQWMLEEDQQCTYLFGVDKLGASALARMVAESLATLDSSQKGRTSDLVDWSLGKVQLSDKPNLQWFGNAATVVLVAMTELTLILLLSLVFGLDPFVSCLGARRGIRSLRLGSNGVTQFADLWLWKVQGREIDDVDGRKTSILVVRPRRDLKLYHVDCTFKIVGLLIAAAFWMLTVFGIVHPFGLKRDSAWGSVGIWAAYVVLVGNVVGIVSSGLPLRLESSLPGQSRDPGYGMLGYSLMQCLVELAVTSLRLVPRLGDSKWLVRCWYIVLEIGIWVEWCAAKRSLCTGPQSSAPIAWELTVLQAGALARAAILAAVSGKWTN